jgi:hypothetical protein
LHRYCASSAASAGGITQHASAIISISACAGALTQQRDALIENRLLPYSLLQHDGSVVGVQLEGGSLTNAQCLATLPTLPCILCPPFCVAVALALPGELPAKSNLAILCLQKHIVNFAACSMPSRLRLRTAAHSLWCVMSALQMLQQQVRNNLQASQAKVSQLSCSS